MERVTTPVEQGQVPHILEYGENTT